MVTCCSGDLGVAQPRGGKHDARDAICISKDTMPEDAIEFGYPYVRAQTQQELKITERVASYNAGDIDKVAHMYESEGKCRKTIAYFRRTCTYRSRISKVSPSKDISSSYGILSLSL